MCGWKIADQKLSWSRMHTDLPNPNHLIGFKDWCPMRAHSKPVHASHPATRRLTTALALVGRVDAVTLFTLAMADVQQR